MPDQSTIDPQAAVDAVLGGAPVAPSLRDGNTISKEQLPTLEPLSTGQSPLPDSETAKVEPIVETVPTELVTENVSPAPILTTTEPAISNPTPTLTSVPATSVNVEEKSKLEENTPLEGSKKPEGIAIGENTPLAFVGMSPNVNEVTTTQVVPPAVIPTMENEPKTKKKGKTKIIVGGILFLVLALGGGIWGYNNYAKIPQIAKVWTWREAQEKREEHEANLRGDGYQAQINANQAAQGGYAGGGSGSNSNAVVGSDLEKEGQLKAIADSAVQAAKAAGLPKEQTDAIYLKIMNAGLIGGAGNYDISGATVEANKVKANLPVAENAGTYEGIDEQGKPIRVYIDAPGVFAAAVLRAQYGQSESDLNILKTTYGMTDKNIAEAASKWEAGMTWVPAGVGCTGMPGQDDPNSSNYCKGWHWTTCAGGKGKDGIGCSGFKTTNEKGEVVYTSTGVVDSTTPTMSCTGITKSPSAPALGGVVTLTCAGTVTPSTAGTLSYKFRYSVNGGNYSTLTNKTATTAELTIAACGTYSVQCQACATLDGVLTCDPTWTGAGTN